MVRHLLDGIRSIPSISEVMDSRISDELKTISNRTLSKWIYKCECQ